MCVFWLPVLIFQLYRNVLRRLVLGVNQVLFGREFVQRSYIGGPGWSWIQSQVRLINESTLHCSLHIRKISLSCLDKLPAGQEQLALPTGQEAVSIVWVVLLNFSFGCHDQGVCF